MDSKRAETIFKKFDGDNSNTMDINEFSSALEMIFDVENGDGGYDEMFDDIFYLIDGRGFFQTKDGKISLSEFKSLCKLLPKDISNKKKSIGTVAFKLIDKGGNGKVSKKELTQYVGKVGIDLKKQEINDLLIALDKNGDDELSLEEFLSLYEP